MNQATGALRNGSFVAEQVADVVMIAGQHDLESVETDPKDDADIQSGAAFEISVAQLADRKTGMLVRGTPGFLELGQGLLDPGVFLVT